MKFLKTIISSSCVTSIKLLSGLIISKAISIYIGPAGIALIGQFQSILQTLMVFSQGGINTGVTKYTAEFSDDSDKRKAIWKSSALITLVCSIFFGVVSIAFSEFISELTFSSSKYTYVFILLGFTLILFSFNQLFLSILNGQKNINAYLSINITQSLFSLFYTTVLIIFWKLNGALIALVTNQSLVFLTVILRFRHHDFFRLKYYRGELYWNDIKKLCSYSLMTLTTAFTAPVSYLIIRKYISHKMSWEFAGYWQAMSSISTLYLMVITTALSIYYLPRLSELKCKLQLRNEIFKGYCFIIPILIVLTLSIFILREFIIQTLFTKDFMPMIQLFKWQLIGDVLKISSWLLVYLLIAKGLVFQVIAIQVIFSFLFIIFSIILFSSMGFVGLSYGYCFTYLINFIVVFILAKKILY